MVIGLQGAGATIMIFLGRFVAAPGSCRLDPLSRQTFLERMMHRLYTIFLFPLHLKPSRVNLTSVVSFPPPSIASTAHLLKQSTLTITTTVHRFTPPFRFPKKFLSVRPNLPVLDSTLIWGFQIKLTIGSVFAFRSAPPLIIYPYCHCLVALCLKVKTWLVHRIQIA